MKNLFLLLFISWIIPAGAQCNSMPGIFGPPQHYFVNLHPALRHYLQVEDQFVFMQAPTPFWIRQAPFFEDHSLYGFGMINTPRTAVFCRMENFTRNNYPFWFSIHAGGFEERMELH